MDIVTEEIQPEVTDDDLTIIDSDEDDDSDVPFDTAEAFMDSVLDVKEQLDEVDDVESSDGEDSDEDEEPEDIEYLDDEEPEEEEDIEPEEVDEDEGEEVQVATEDAVISNLVNFDEELQYSTPDWVGHINLNYGNDTDDRPMTAEDMVKAKEELDALERQVMQLPTIEAKMTPLLKSARYLIKKYDSDISRLQDIKESVVNNNGVSVRTYDSLVRIDSAMESRLPKRMLYSATPSAVNLDYSVEAVELRRQELESTKELLVFGLLYKATNYILEEFLPIANTVTEQLQGHANYIVNIVEELSVKQTTRSVDDFKSAIQELYPSIEDNVITTVQSNNVIALALSAYMDLLETERPENFGKKFAYVDPDTLDGNVKAITDGFVVANNLLVEVCENIVQVVTMTTNGNQVGNGLLVDGDKLLSTINMFENFEVYEGQEHQIQTPVQVFLAIKPKVDTICSTIKLIVDSLDTKELMVYRSSFLQVQQDKNHPANKLVGVVNLHEYNNQVMELTKLITGIYTLLVTVIKDIVVATKLMYTAVHVASQVEQTT